MKRHLPVCPSLTHLRHQAKALVREVHSGNAEATVRCREHHPRFPNPSDFSLSDAQLVIAREYGFASWPKIKNHVEALEEIDIQGGMPLAAAVSFNVIRAVEALLDCGAAVDGVDRDGPPLAYALHFGYPKIAQLLAQRGATLDLRFATGLGMLDAVKSWFNADGSLKPGAGALVDPYALERKLKGESPFRCERTRENILSQALYFACTHSRLDIADFLLSQGADVNAIVPGLDFRATVLHRVASMDVGGRRTRWRMEEAVRFLVDHGADLTIRDEEYGGTPLGWARYAGRDEAVDLLRSLGASD